MKTFIITTPLNRYEWEVEEEFGINDVVALLARDYEDEFWGTTIQEKGGISGWIIPFDYERSDLRWDAIVNKNERQWRMLRSPAEYLLWHMAEACLHNYSVVNKKEVK